MLGLGGAQDVLMSDLLVQRGWLKAQDRSDVERLLQRKLQRYQGDASLSLAETATDSALRALAVQADADIDRSLADLPALDGSVALSGVVRPPQTRQRYNLLSLCGKGGIGQVWQAHDDDLGRDVALKELQPDHAGHPSHRRRFLHEAQVTSQLEHPGIVPVYELVRPVDGSPPFYTMRLVHGRTMSDAANEYRRKRQEGKAGPLELRDLLQAFVSVCDAPGLRPFARRRPPRPEGRQHHPRTVRRGAGARLGPGQERGERGL